MNIGYDYIGVGCGALIINENKETLLVKRTTKTRNEAGFWSKPGGGVEFGERVENAVKREIKEELGVDIEIIKFLGFTDSIMENDKQHWISFNYLAKIKGGELENLEPEKHEEIKWFGIDSLPDNVNQYTKESIKEYLKLNKKNYGK
jgi:ADP-ribose pyrophosphatase